MHLILSLIEKHAIKKRGLTPLLCLITENLLLYRFMPPRIYFHWLAH